MFSRLKRVLVESYIGTIALGWLLADVVLDFVNIFVSPVASWIQRGEIHGVFQQTEISTGFMLKDALSPFVKSVLLLLIWYILLRWLYMNPVTKEPPETMGDSGMPLSPQ